MKDWADKKLEEMRAKNGGMVPTVRAVLMDSAEVTQALREARAEAETERDSVLANSAHSCMADCTNAMNHIRREARAEGRRDAHNQKWGCREEIQRLRGALEVLHAEAQVWALRGLERVANGCREGISTVPNSLAHNDCEMAILRLKHGLDKASEVLAAYSGEVGTNG